jgi:uncharacterized protein
MYAPRGIDAELLAWADEPGRRPLILRGARQTGKTAAVRRLAERFDGFAELNLERRTDLSLIEGCESPDDLLLALRVRHDWERFPERTLLFLDEVQESARAVRWLGFLHEEHPELAVVAAGSLMEVRLTDRDFSFPVGRVTYRYVHPFTFFEYLDASGRAVLRAELERAAVGPSAIPKAIHQQAMEMLRDYLLVGGMPAAVSAWVESRSPTKVRQLQRDLIQAFADDLHKYRGVRDPEPLGAAFDALPHHYGCRFKYAGFAPESRSGQMKAALDKLEGAMLIDRAVPTSSFGPPNRRRPRSAPKLLALDVGLALASASVPFDEARRSDPLQILGGRAAEMLVGQALRSRQLRTRDALWFWVAESARSNAEIDFLAGDLPVEIKSGKSGTLKSLHLFLARGGGRTGVRLYTGSLDDRRHSVSVPDHGELVYRLVSLPLYLAEMLAEPPAWKE